MSDSADEAVRSARRAAIVLFATTAAIKLVLLIALGPIFTPDSSGYVALAEMMQASSDWMHHLDLSAWLAPFAFRMIGYPAVIAGAMLVSGWAWAYVVTVLQSLLSFVAGWALYRLTIEMGLSWRWSIAAVAAFLLSFPLTFDQAMLTDSLNASFLVLAVCLLSHGACARRPFSAGAALGAGLFLVLALLLREAGQFLWLALVPVLVARIWLAGSGRRIRSALAGLLVLVPLFVTIEAYKTWNYQRSGERFITTGASTTVLQAIASAAQFDPAAIAGDTPLERAARKILRHSSFEEVLALNAALSADGYKATDISRMAYAHYFALWHTHPLAMLFVLRMHISERAAKLTVRPVDAVCESIAWATNRQACHDYRDLYRAVPTGFSRMGWSAPATFVVRTIEQTLAIGLFAGFLIGVPCHVVARIVARRSAIEGAALLIGAYWLMYLAWFVAYGIVHLEDRYMMPVVPFSIVAGLYVWRDFFRRWYPVPVPRDLVSS